MTIQALIEPWLPKGVRVRRGRPQALSQQRHRVLIVDDDHAVAEVLSLGLDCHGYDVDIARTCREAGEKLASGRYSFVILDLTSRTAPGSSSTTGSRPTGPAWLAASHSSRPQPSAIPRWAS